jgi:hypothetical protein
MNLLTHFRKSTILRFVLAGLVLLFLVPALFADGIASRYPNDVGIENDPDVILADGFESYTSPSQLTQKWDLVSGVSRMRIATEPGKFFAGHKSLEMQLPVSQVEHGEYVLLKPLSPTEPVLYVRVYEKFDLGFLCGPGTAPGHNGIRIAGDYPGTPGHKAPPDGSGFFLFTLENADWNRGGENQPGFAHIYAYWPYQRTNYGDHFYPDGWVIPGGWGLWILHPFQYPNFRPMPNWQPIRGIWYCYEYMVKINDLGRHNGEIAFWINGQLKGRWTNLFMRSRQSLKIDEVGLLLHAIHSTRLNKKWYDNVVIARSYIGPISH